MFESDPMRMCVGCKAQKPKSALIRLVRDKSGAVVDDSGGSPGRGAYICRSFECVESAFTGRRLSKVCGKSAEADLDRLKREIVNRIG